MKSLRKLIALFLIGAMLLPAVVACTDPEEPVTETTTAAPVMTYTVRWKSDDGTVLETDEGVPADAVPTYDGAIPTKAGTDQIDYVYSNLSEQQITSQASHLAHVKPCENRLLEGDADGRYYYKYVFDVSALTDTTALCFAHQGGSFVAIIAARLIP